MIARAKAWLQVPLGALRGQVQGLTTLDSWRSHVLSVILCSVVILGAIVAVPSVIIALIEGLWPVAVADAIALVWLVVLWRNKTLSFHARAWNFCALLYLLGLSFLLTIGTESQVYLMAFPVMAALLLGLRPAVFALMLNAASLFSIGYFTDANVRIAGLEGAPLLKWMVITLNFALVNAMLTLSIVLLLRGLQKSLESAHDSKELYRATFEKAPIGVSRLDLAGNWIQVNRRMCELTGYTEAEMLELNYRDITHAEDLPQDDLATGCLMLNEAQGQAREKRYIQKNGQSVWIHVQTSLVRDASGKPMYFLSVATDISERKKSEARINELAYFDHLTGLPNRALLLDRLNQAMAASKRDGCYGALLFINLDHFKDLNDTHGHDMGDLLLRQVGQRLITCVRAGDTVARLGGDEFIVMLTGLGLVQGDALGNACMVADEVLIAMNQPYALAGLNYQITPSIGVTLFDEKLLQIEELMRQADLAMYHAKTSGRNTVCLFEPAMAAAIVARTALQNDLHRAVETQQFFLHYQPQVDRDGHLTGAEVLLRWLHPQRGIVSPANFIPVAEETGLILPLGQWVLHTACTQLAVWAGQAEMAHLTVAVNVSVIQFRQAGFVDQVLEELEATRANPLRLKLELTESVLVSNMEDVIEKMIALKAHGVRFSLDDFGTGYSSLAYLKRLPLDQLKIDQSFVRDILHDPNDAAIARTVVALGQSMGLDVIAEGVETAEQRTFLASVGCHAYQGYLFSRPLTLPDFETFAKAQLNVG